MDTTQAVREGLRDIITTLFIAIGLVAIVVFVFLQDVRATLIPLAAVPVSLVGTFAFFPLLGFSINTLSLFGLVLAIGLVVDDAIVVVEAVQRHIDEGMTPHDAALKAMDEVSTPVIAIALILASVFIPTAFIPGISGRLFQQFALDHRSVGGPVGVQRTDTEPGARRHVAAAPREEGRGLIGRAVRRLQPGLRGNDERLHPDLRPADPAIGDSCCCSSRSSRQARSSSRVECPRRFCRRRIRATRYVALQLPNAASLQRSDAAARKIEEIMKHTPGVQGYMSVVGFNLFSQVQATYNSFFFVTLKPWGERPTADAIQATFESRALHARRRAWHSRFHPRRSPASARLEASRSCCRTA